MAHPISVLLPVYNCERYVGAAVQSILDQTFADFELIIIDDGSTDGSSAILRAFADRDARVRLVARPNTGYVRALNEAAALATGEFLARMDADDVSLPGRFAAQVAYLRAHPDCVLLGTQVIMMDGDGDLIGPMPDVAFGHDAIDRALLDRGWPVVHPSVMMRRAALAQVGGYRAEFCPKEDHDAFLRLAELGRVENLPEPWVHYRRHAGSVSAQSVEASGGLLQRIVEAAHVRRGHPTAPVPARTPAPPPPNRPGGWVWIALKGGRVATARKYAWIELRRRPFSSASWHLLYCALRGR